MRVLLAPALHAPTVAATLPRFAARSQADPEISTTSDLLAASALVALSASGAFADSRPGGTGLDQKPGEEHFILHIGWGCIPAPAERETTDGGDDPSILICDTTSGDAGAVGAAQAAHDPGRGSDVFVALGRGSCVGGPQARAREVAVRDAPERDQWRHW